MDLDGLALPAKHLVIQHLGTCDWRSLREASPLASPYYILQYQMAPPSFIGYHQESVCKLQILPHAHNSSLNLDVMQDVQAHSPSTGNT